MELFVINAQKTVETLFFIPLEKIFGSDSEFMKKLSFVTDRIESNAEANLQSVSSTYSSTADIMSSFNSSKYDFLG